MAAVINSPVLHVPMGCSELFTEMLKVCLVRESWSKSRLNVTDDRWSPLQERFFLNVTVLKKWQGARRRVLNHTTHTQHRGIWCSPPSILRHWPVFGCYIKSLKATGWIFIVVFQSVGFLLFLYRKVIPRTNLALMCVRVREVSSVSDGLCTHSYKANETKSVHVKKNGHNCYFCFGFIPERCRVMCSIIRTERD